MNEGPAIPEQAVEAALNKVLWGFGSQRWRTINRDDVPEMAREITAALPLVGVERNSVNYAERADEMSTTTRRAIFVPLAWMARVVTWAFLGPAWVFLVPGCWLMQLSDWLHSQQSKPTNREAQP